MTSLLSLVDSLGHGWAYERKPMKIRDRLAPYAVLHESWHYRDPRTVTVDLDLLAAPTLPVERSHPWGGEQALQPADYRNVLDLVAAS